MGALYNYLFRPLFFTQEPERSHEMAVKGLEVLARMPLMCKLMMRYNSVSNAKPIELFGLKFPNAIGLAAGFDKNAKCWPAAAALGFGHVEIGTVTHQKQPGNPRPRLFRYPEEEAIINRMGFNNDGAEEIAKRLNKMRVRPIPLGINLGKSKAVSLEHAAEDYLGSFHKLADYADYITINVSSPNTPGLRELQGGEHLPELLKAISQANIDRGHRLGAPPLPLLLKIAPDLSYPQIDSVLETISDLGYSGIIATNTTISRPGVNSKESGGLSGKPLRPLSLQVIKYISRATSGKLPIIGSGGILDEKSCGDALDAGASLVQIYTGMIYKGPFLARDLARSAAWHHRQWV